jgi:hypothetical protein
MEIIILLMSLEPREPIHIARGKLSKVGLKNRAGGISYNRTGGIRAVRNNHNTGKAIINITIIPAIVIRV